jgi:hypothetical protein
MMGGDNDVEHGVAYAGGDSGPQIAGGWNGFKLVGIALGLAVHSRALGYTMGAFGGGMSHVFELRRSRGHEVTFPKRTAMEIGISRQQANTSGGTPEHLSPQFFFLQP